MDKASAAPGRAPRTDEAGPPGRVRRRYPWLVPGGLLLILAFLTVNVLADGPMVAADRRIRAAVQSQANSHTWKWLKVGPWSPARVLVDMGNVRVAVPVLMTFAVLVAIRHRSWRPLLTAITGVVLLLGTVVSAKILVARPNPGFSSLNGHLLGAFPSGHTSSSCVCYFLAVLLLSARAAPRARRTWLVLTGVLCFLIGSAMVWCDLHWFTDVAASWALSPLLIGLTTRLARQRAKPPEPVPARQIESRHSPAR